jgi:surface antigen
MTLKRLTLAALAALVLTSTLPILALADPPPWAPAHGWRRKHDPYYVGYHGRKWPNDYGILGGRCNRARIGAVLGGAVGGVVGASIGKGDTRAVATVLGSVLGAVIGHEIGRDMDEADRGCFGHSLELAKDGQTIQWQNPDAGLVYALTPIRSFQDEGRPCREFTLRTTYGTRGRAKHATACRSDDGVWYFG